MAQCSMRTYRWSYSVRLALAIAVLAAGCSGTAARALQFPGSLDSGLLFDGSYALSCLGLGVAKPIERPE